jgi:hypothetical protein
LDTVIFDANFRKFRLRFRPEDLRLWEKSNNN